MKIDLPTKYYAITFSKLIRKYQSGFILLIVIGTVLLVDTLFANLFSNRIDLIFANTLGEKQHQVISQEIIQFAPEAWLSLLGLVLGTLIIVISVASQSTPKLIDLYANDRTSLLYVWYIVVGSVHNMFLQLFSKVDPIFFKSSMLLNTYLMLPAALLMAVPYVLYILRYTKTSNVIERIFADNQRGMYRLQTRAELQLLEDKKTISEYQFRLFESLNQLDDLLEYVDFKEPKGDIINKISLSIQTYIQVKKSILKNAPQFFKISGKIATDVSFKTMTGQFAEMEKTHTFYEQKGFRLLGNAYIRLIDHDEFDLASLCAYELSECGRAAIEYLDKDLLNVVFIRFNTLIRFGIKHGLKNKEARNLYNAIFHYSGFIHHIIQHKNTAFIKRSCTYLNIYVNEIYRHSRKEPSFVFLVDAFTWEFKRILIELNKNELEIALQKEILGLFLKIDNLSDKYDEIPLQGRKFSSGIRGLQVSLALYYVKVQAHSLVESIVIDILNDHEYMDKEELREALRGTCRNLENASPTFWEDTDRGNSNLYYSEDVEYISDLLLLFDEMLENHRLITKRNNPSSNPK